MQTFVKSIATDQSCAEPSSGSVVGKCLRERVPIAREQISIWAKFGGDMPELQAIAQRLLACHATSASTERNWSLWGRIYSSARTRLGMERAKCLIAICADEKRKIPAQEFDISI
jgi:hypothetical protein